MNARQARRERREAERKARKAELRRIKTNPALPHDGSSSEGNTTSPEDRSGARPRLQPHLGTGTKTLRRTRLETNRENAQFSTGPRTPKGKSASSRNSTKHGLTSQQTIIPGEDPAAFEALLADLVAEHRPASETESLLVSKLAQSFWLEQRALRRQNECFTAEGIDEKRLALFLRYATTHSRAFYKALGDLLRLQKERRKSENTRSVAPIGFVSQPVPLAPDESGFVSQNAAGRKVTGGFVSQTGSQNAA